MKELKFVKNKVSCAVYRIELRRASMAACVTNTDDLKGKPNPFPGTVFLV